jgi:hypothetical protein
MQFLVSFKVEPSMHSPDGVAAARTAGTAFFAGIGQDPRVKASGHFADGRGGFMLIELNSAEEMLQFTGPFLDFVRFESHPVLPLAAIAQMFTP